MNHRLTPPAHGLRPSPLRTIPAAALLVAAAAFVLAAGPAHAGFTPGAVQTFGTVGAPRSVALGDMNNDGIEDMVVTSETGNGISVLRGLGGGAFAPALNSYGAGNPMGAVVLADFDNDGKLDAAVPLTASGNYFVFVLKGNGDCTFPFTYYFSAPPHPEFLVAADFNEDGKMDLATAGYSSTSTGTAAVYLNTTTSFINMARTDYAVGAQPRGITAATLTGTNHKDLVTANSAAGNISILKNDGTGHFGNRLDIATQTSSFAVTTGWLFSGLSRPQIVTANRDSASISFVYYSDATSSWTRKNFATAAGPRGVTIADPDGDGNNDVLVAAYSANKISILSVDNYSSAILQPKLDITVGTNPYAALVVNWDGDMKRDLLTVDRGANQVRVTHGVPTVGWALGDTIPDFSAPNQNGHAVQFSKLRGKWLMLDLCSVWCIPCRLMAMTTLDTYMTWYGNPDVNFEYITALIDGITIGTPSTQTDAQNWGTQFHINRPILHSGGLAGNGIRAVAQSSQLTATPTLRLIDPSGRVVWLNLGAVADTTIHRVLANAAGVAQPTGLGAAALASGAATVTYGPNVVSSPADPADEFMFPFYVSGFGENMALDFSMGRDWLAGTESWFVDLWYGPWDGAPNLPPRQLGTDYPWQITLSDLVLDPVARTLPPNAVATISIVDTFLVAHAEPITVPVTWENGTLTLGAVPAATLAALPPIFRLQFTVPMLIGQPVADAGPHRLPAALELRAPWPNPARGTSRIAWSQPKEGAATLAVYDVTGRRVRTLSGGVAAAGDHSAAWDLTDESGARVGAGLYFARLAVAGAGERTARLTVLH